MAYKCTIVILCVMLFMRVSSGVYPECCEHTDSVGATVLDECPWDDLQRFSHRSVRPLTHPGDALGFLQKQLREGEKVCLRIHQIRACSRIFREGYLIHNDK